MHRPHLTVLSCWDHDRKQRRIFASCIEVGKPVYNPRWSRGGEVLRLPMTTVLLGNIRSYTCLCAYLLYVLEKAIDVAEGVERQAKCKK